MGAAPKVALPSRGMLRQLLGLAPGDVSFVEVAEIGRSEQNGMAVSDLEFTGDHGEKVPAYLLAPDGAEDGEPGPALLYCHAHGNDYAIGRNELLDGRKGLTRPYGPDLVNKLGLTVLCLEMPCFGPVRNQDESSLSKQHLWRGTTQFGQMLAELSAGVDHLLSLPAVDPGRLGIAGFSMGGTHAFWLAALDDRIKACAHMSCFADMDCLISSGAHDGHGHYMTVPRLLLHSSTASLAGRIAPRQQLACVGLKDWSTPPECFNKAREELESVYAYVDAHDAIHFHVDPEAGHHETARMRKDVLSFLKEHL